MSAAATLIDFSLSALFRCAHGDMVAIDGSSCIWAMPDFTVVAIVSPGERRGWSAT